MDIVRKITFSISLFFLITLTLIPSNNAGNILAIFQHHGYSHFSVYYPVLKALAERGHNLTVITYTKNPESHPNYKELILTGEAQINVMTFDEVIVSRRPSILIMEYLALHTEGQKSCKNFYESTYVETVLSNHAVVPYDLVLTEYFNTDCHLGVPYLMEVPVIAFSSCALMPWLYDRITLPDTPSYIQSEFIGFPEQLNVFERLLNFCQAKLLKLFYRFYTNSYDNKVIKKYLNIDIDITEVAKRLTSVVFVNQHYSLSGSRPITPQLIEIGGVHITEKALNRTLPANIADFLSKVKPNQDVIVISFGSMLKATSFDKSKLKSMLKVLQKRNFKIIWKWEADDLPLKSEQILFAKWIPQLSLLCHPKVKYFWGHGGMLSTTEALYCGKPLILTPIYGDQFLNAHAVQNRKIGVILDYHKIDENNVESTLNEIQRPRYITNAQALSKIFRDREMTPLNKAVWNIEHILKHKTFATEILKTKAMDINFFIYHSLDSIVIIALSLVLIIVLCKRILKPKSSAFKAHKREEETEKLNDRKNR